MGVRIYYKVIWFNSMIFNNVTFIIHINVNIRKTIHIQIIYHYLNIHVPGPKTETVRHLQTLEEILYFICLIWVITWPNWTSFPTTLKKISPVLMPLFGPLFIANLCVQMVVLKNALPPSVVNHFFLHQSEENTHHLSIFIVRNWRIHNKTLGVLCKPFTSIKPSSHLKS